MHIAHKQTAVQITAETAAEYFDDLAGLSNTQLYRVLQIRNMLPHKPSPGENPRKGAAAPFLVVLRGIVKGENRNSPLTMLSFDRQRRFLSHMRKKAGLKHSLFWQDRKEWAAGGIPHGWCRKNRLPEVSCAIPAQKSMYSACKIKKPSQDKPTTVGRG